MVLRQLLRRGLVRRNEDGGKRGNPFRYELENARSQNLDESSDRKETRERELSDANKGVKLDFGILAPVFPIRSSGNENLSSVPRTYEDPTTLRDSRSLVPGCFETTSDGTPEHHEPSINTGLDSRSQDREMEGEYERF